MEVNALLHSEVIFGIITSLISIFFFLGSRFFPEGTVDGVPGPGYFPTLLSVFLFVLSVALIISGLKKEDRYFALTETINNNLKSLFLTMLSMAGFLIMWRYVPFVISAFLFLLFLNLIFKQSMKFSLMFSAVMVGIVYYVFSNVFNVILDL